MIELEVPIQLEIPNAMHSGESTLTASQNQSANDNENSYDKDVCTMKKRTSDWTIQEMIMTSIRKILKIHQK